MNAEAKPKVVIFSDHLLYPSETFIRAQALALTEFEPVFAGSRLIRGGLDLPKDRTHVISQGDIAGRIHEAAFKLLGVAPRLTRALRDLNPVLLHAHFGADGLRALPVARALGIPLIVTFHGSDATATDLRHKKAPFGHRRYLARRDELKKGGALFLAVSEFIRRKLLEQGYPEEKVKVHYTGVDTSQFRPAKIARDPIILFVGRLVERKGPEYVIRAAAQVQKEIPTAELVVIGDGPLRADLQRQAKESLQSYRFLGARSPDEVREWMNRAAIFCAPSVKMPWGEEEGFGMVYAEAMAMQLPVVAFDSGGVSEVVSHGNTGFLVAERDWLSLAKYLCIFLRDAAMRRRFGIAGRERVLRDFDLDQRTKMLEAIYTNLLGTKTQAVETATGLVRRRELPATIANAAAASTGFTGPTATD